MYNIQQIDVDARWRQEPIVDVIFVREPIVPLSFAIVLHHW